MSSTDLTKEQEDKVLKEIGYSRAQLQRDIPSLRLWLQEQTHLPACRLGETDIFLSNYLVGCKGSIETAKRKLDHYYSLRGRGDVFTDRDNFDYVDRISKYSATVSLPKNAPDNCTLMISALLDDDLELYIAVETLKNALLLFEHKLRYGTGIAGPQYHILDASKYSISHFMKLPPIAMKAFMSFFQDAWPLRVKKILITNVPSVLATAINTVIVPFFNKKMKERFVLTSEPLEKVFEYSLDLLPEDYKGGKQRNLRQLSEEWQVKARDLKNILPQLQEETDESKRPKLKNGISDSYFGLHGSIKTLVLD